MPPPPSTPPPQPFNQERFRPSSTLASPGLALGISSLSLRSLPSPSTSTLASVALLHPRTPPQLRKLFHCTKLSWHSAKRRRCTKDRQFAKEYFRCQLESFRQEIRDHYIVEFGGSHRVYACGPHSGKFYSTSLRALLSLDYVPHQVKIPCWHLPHVCAYCHRVPLSNNLWRYVFAHISAEPRRRGRPSQPLVLEILPFRDISITEVDSDNSDAPSVDS